MEKTIAKNDMDDRELCRSAVSFWARLTAALGPLGDLSYLRPASRERDDLSKILVRSSSGRPMAVIKLSPRAVCTAAAEQQLIQVQARNYIGDDLGRVFLEPLDQGEIDGRSYVVLPYCWPLEAFPFAIWRKTYLWWKVTRWLRRVAEQTKKLADNTEIENDFLRPLSRIASDERFSSLLRDEAKMAIKGISAGRWRPTFVLAHNDLWRDNILLLNRSWLNPRFAFLDWGAARVRGYPFYDLIRLARSFGVPKPLLKRQVRLHERILSCDWDGAKGMLLAALGKIVIEPDHMLVDHYIKNFESTFAWMLDCRARDGSP